MKTFTIKATSQLCMDQDIEAVNEEEAIRIFRQQGRARNLTIRAVETKGTDKVKFVDTWCEACGKPCFDGQYESTEDNEFCRDCFKQLPQPKGKRGL